MGENIYDLGFGDIFLQYWKQEQSNKKNSCRHGSSGRVPA
jgi:hypothetical protein